MILELSHVPQRPGVYIFKGTRDKILYVGKAKNLRNRLRSYFQENSNLEPRKVAMVRKIKDFSYIVTDSELEALILEASLIKLHKPNFNIILRDDKNYPYIKLTMTEQWPRIEVVRGIKKDGDLYFGPYIPSQAMWEAIAFIRKNFFLRTCSHALDKPLRPCIEHQMKKCPGPCAGLISAEEYGKIVQEVKLFLSGERKGLLDNLEHKMQALAEEMKFEEAALVRDSISRLRRALESQKVLAPELGDVDVFGYFREDDSVAAHVLFVRNGILIGAKDFFIEKAITTEEAEVMHSVIELFYSKEIIPPPLILLNRQPKDRNALLQWLTQKRGGRVVIEAPKKGKKFDLLGMADDNAKLHFTSRRKAMGDGILTDLRDRLHLSRAPHSIGAFDVSTIQGTGSVGAFIYWADGDFRKEMYRRLHIKTVQGVDDYSMMKEIVGRTLKGIEDSVPDLVLIDGGRGQLEVARQAVEELGIDTDLVSIAKKPDRAVLLSGEFIDLEDRNKASLFLKMLRDEVHRFAVEFHRKVRDKKFMESPLEKIPGIGKARRLELLKHFGGLDAIRNAQAEEIMQIRGFNRKTAEKILAEVQKIKKETE
jgi:excinuclease ABC subunit C